MSFSIMLMSPGCMSNNLPFFLHYDLGIFPIYSFNMLRSNFNGFS